MSGVFPSSPIEIRLQDTMGGHTIANHVLNLKVPLIPEN
jgi:hypothetical protein